MNRTLVAAALTIAALVPALARSPQQRRSYLTPPFVSEDPVARLEKRMASGEVKLKYEGATGYLRSVLRALGVSSVSQTLVFSKTSLQINEIGPKTPRAVYFSDDCYVGWANGAEYLELMGMDPVRGAVFYVLPNAPSPNPEFVRQTFACLSCHGGVMSGEVPGPVMRSVYPSRDGRPALQNGSYLTTDASPMSERWGGWYVTGTHGKQRHMGNAFVRGDDTVSEMNVEPGANLKALNQFFDSSPYLSPHSDIVALTVLAHQIRLHNLLTKAHQGVADALRDMKIVHPELPAGTLSESAESRIRSVCEPVVEALFCIDEAPFDEPIAGTSGYAAQYAARGPRDVKGRSLRELDLKKRLYRYGFSPLVYSPALSRLPDPGRKYLVRRLREVLDGTDKSKLFSRISPADREAVSEILQETWPLFSSR